MTTHRSVVSELERAATAGESVVLATVVRIIGSSYGGVGTRMVIRTDGATVGLVSGGCLESDLCQHALAVHETGRARVITYDTRTDDDAVWGLGLGCNGLIEVLLDPLPPARAREIAGLLTRALNATDVSVLATVLKAKDVHGAPAVGAQALVNKDIVASAGDWGDGHALDLLPSRAGDALAAGRGGLTECFGGTAVAFEVLAPAVQLVVCGSGPDTAPLVRFASQLGWSVTVVDHRPVTESHAARFPGTPVIECVDPARLGETIFLGPRTAAVVMSHHFARDTDYLQALLSACAGYVGVLGPRARTERMLAELATREHGLSPGNRELFAPVGLDLGSEGPDAIALAIVAEIAAVTNDRPATHLRDKPGALHEANVSAAR